jgi:putative aminopeptidase FrvX
MNNNSKKYFFNIKDTFISLVSKTNPHGSEDYIINLLPELNKDMFGNYYHIIGENPETMFTAHLDNHCKKEEKVDIKTEINDNGDEFIFADSNTILGADDKAGIVVLLYMIHNNINGLYYFFIGEESGCIGSKNLYSKFNEIDYLRNIKRCITFDRKDITSIITYQSEIPCCSKKFANSLKKEYEIYNINLELDSTGIWSDGAEFMDKIKECTNLSVGFYNEHEKNEKQNISYLDRFCKASININWDELPTDRKSIIKNYNEFFNFKLF